MQNILIIEDNKSVNRMLSRYLTKEGYNVKCLSNSDNVLEYVRKTDYQFLFFEPKMHWAKVLQDIKSGLPEIKVIAMIGGYEDDKLLAHLNQEKIVFIQKPFELKEVRQVIDSFLKDS